MGVGIDRVDHDVSSIVYCSARARPGKTRKLIYK